MQNRRKLRLRTHHRSKARPIRPTSRSATAPTARPAPARRSASSVLVRGTSFKMTGTPKDYLKLTADSGTPRIQAFCPECGSPIYSTSPGEGVQDAYRVRVGILRQRKEFVPKKQNWFRSALPWITALARRSRRTRRAGEPEAAFVYRTRICVVRARS